MAYHALTLTAQIPLELARGLRELPIESVPGAERCEPGQPVRLVSPAGSLEALALADPENQLVRVFARASEGFGALDAGFFRARVRQALALRAGFGLRRAETTHRLLHGAGDGVPGLCADVYGEHAVLYVYARGLQRQGKTERAFELYPQVPKKDPNHWISHLALARIDSNKRDFSAAAKEMTQAISGAPEANKPFLEPLLKRLQANDDINK